MKVFKVLNVFAYSSLYEIHVQLILCSWAVFFPTGSPGRGSPTWSPAPPAALTRWAAQVRAAPSPWTGWSRPGPTAPADLEGFLGPVLSAFSSTPWSGTQIPQGSPSAGWHWGAGKRTNSLVMNRHHAAKPHHQCTSPEWGQWVAAEYPRPVPDRNTAVPSRHVSLDLKSKPVVLIIGST